MCVGSQGLDERAYLHDSLLLFTFWSLLFLHISGGQGWLSSDWTLEMQADVTIHVCYFACTWHTIPKQSLNLQLTIPGAVSHPILPLPLINDGQLLVTGESMHT